MKFGKSAQERERFLRECEEGKHDSRRCVFALIPKYCHNTERYVWLEPVWRIRYYWHNYYEMTTMYEEVAQ